MCKCTPEIRTPFCGATGCEIPAEWEALEGSHPDAIEIKYENRIPVEEMPALFIPLMTRWFNEFRDGFKDTEYRPFGPRWNGATCRVGRKVILSKGYGKRERLSGIIVKFEVSTDICYTSTWIEIYGTRKPAACIGIKILR